jgi:hypothetical protein
MLKSLSKLQPSLITFTSQAMLVVVLALVCSSKVMAGPSNEIFSAVPDATITRKAPAPPMPANPVAAPGAMAMIQGGPKTPEVIWFENLDEIVFQGHPTNSERILLSTPFNQEAERVQRWTYTANNVAKRYHLTAKQLRHLAVPYERRDLRDYQNQRADWFDDAAQVYEEMLRPRRAAQTIDELESQLRKVKQDAQLLETQKKTILASERDLRRLYRVHAPKHSDALTKYVTGQNPTR